MYPKYATPEIRVESTVNNPADTAEVHGFRGRDETLGRDALVMKEEAVRMGVNSEVVLVPESDASRLVPGGVLFVLTENKALIIGGSDFAMESQSTTLEGRDGTVDVREIRLDSERFNEIPRRDVEVGV